MKKLLTILVVLVTVTGHVMATDDKPVSPLGMAVVKAEGGFKLFYKGNKAQDVTVTIYNATGKALFTEKIKNRDSFIRPYNVNSIGEGVYTIELVNADGKLLEKINYKREEVKARQNLLNLIHVKNSEKYLLTIPGKGENKLSIKVIGENETLLHEEKQKVNGDFAKLFNFEKLDGKFRVEVTDQDGETFTVAPRN